MSEETQETTLSTALTLHSMSLAEKTRTGLSIGIPATLLFEVCGGSLLGLGLAACLGLASGYWSEELPDWVNWLPAPKQHARSKQSKLQWWLTGESLSEEDEGEESSLGPSLDRIVDLGDNLKLDIDDIAGKAVFICGIRRSGKTTLGVHIAEEMGKFNIAMLIPCLKGDWLSAAATLPNARVWGQKEVQMKHARALGWAILERGMQLIFNIASYDDINEACAILAEIIIGLFEWAKAHPEDRRLCEVFLDEAQTFLPQDVGDSIISDTEVRNALQNAYMRVIALGGSYGLAPVIMTQRIAQVAKKIIGQPELLFLLKQTMDNDLQRYREFTDVPVEQIRGLKQGHGVFVSYEGVSSVHSFHKRTSDDSMSRTPRADLSPSPKTHKFSDDELEIEGYGESENTMKQPLKLCEGSERLIQDSESSERLGEVFTLEQEQTIILTALAIAQSGQKLTRSAIKERLGWTNKQWDIIKAVCDKHNIAS